MKLNLFTLAIILVFVALFVLQASALPWTPAHIIGMAVSVPALALLIVARIQLGGAFSVRAKASTLVTTGLYSRFRNPIYVLERCSSRESSSGSIDPGSCSSLSF